MTLPEEWESTNDYDSHRPLLYTALLNTERNVVEFGCGWGSTKLLNDFCFGKRGFLSFETDETWARRLNANYGIGFTKYLELNATPNGLLFIDSFPGEERKYLIAKHSYDSKVIVVHDTEEGSDYVYKMKEILNMFKFRLDYKPEGKPQTTAVSNYIDVSKWIIPE